MTTEQVQQDISRFHTEFGRLTIELREISPDDTLFATPLFVDSSDPMDDMSLNSSASTELKNIMKATKKQVIQLRARLAELKHGSPPDEGSVGPASDKEVGGPAQGT